MTIILTEKSSAAQSFAEALDAEKRGGYYEASGYLITWCVGHLYELAEPETYRPEAEKWSLETLPIIPERFLYRVIRKTADRTEFVTSLLKKYSGEKIIIATDADREGELIAREVIGMAGLSDRGNFFRFWVSEALTPDVVRSGIGNVKAWRDYIPLFYQGAARQQSDWLVGMNLTRFVTCCTGELFTVGRVQTAVVAAIRKRNLEIENFRPEPYRELAVKIRDRNGTEITAKLLSVSGSAAFSPGDPYLSAAAADIRKNGITGCDVQTSERHMQPPELMSLTDLQKKAARLYDYSADATLETAQKLYEEYKCLSYPRTPSRVMGDDNVPLFRQMFDRLRNLTPVSSYAKAENIRDGNRRIFNSKKLESHHALIPLAPLPDSAGEREKNIYGIVLESFFLVCCDECILALKQLCFHSGGYRFAAAIQTVKQSGWRAAVSGASADDDCDEKEEEQNVESFDEKSAAVSGIETENKMTKAPKQYTLASLLAFMQNPKNEHGDEKLYGLGQEATRAEIIRKIFDKEYVVKQKKMLYATDKGKFLVSALEKNSLLAGLLSCEQTTAWEKQLAENPKTFEKSIEEYVRKICTGPKISGYEKKSPGICPLCGCRIAEGKAAWYCEGYKNDPKCEFEIWKNSSGTVFSFQDAAKLLTGGKIRKSCRSKAGKTYKADFHLSGGELKREFVDTWKK